MNKYHVSLEALHTHTHTHTHTNSLKEYSIRGCALCNV